MKEEENVFYETGKKFIELGGCLQNKESTISDLAEKSFNCGLRIGFGFIKKNQFEELEVLKEEINTSLLGGRAQSALNHLDVKTYGDLVKVSGNDVLKCRGVGRKGLIEIIQLLKEKGLTLRD